METSEALETKLRETPGEQELLAHFHYTASLGPARYGWASLGLAHFMAHFHYSLGTGVVSIVTQCRRSRDVIFNENPRKTTQPLAVSTQSSQLLISVQKLDKS